MNKIPGIILLQLIAALIIQCAQKEVEVREDYRLHKHETPAVSACVEDIPVVEVSGLYPNPFGPTQIYKFELCKSGNVNLELTTLDGIFVESIYEGYLEKGVFSCIPPSAKTPVGMYLLVIKYNDEKIVSSKFILLK